MNQTKPPFPKYIERRRVEVDGFTRVVSARDAFDFRGTEHGNYGQSGVKIDYSLIGPLGAISWRLFTGIYVRDEASEPSAGAVVSHLSDPQGGNCDLLPGGKCSGDIGFMIGDDVLAALHQSEDTMWAKLLDIYNEWIVSPDKEQA